MINNTECFGASAATTAATGCVVEDSGYDVELASGDVPAELNCVICMKLMRDPVQFTCGHGMCSACYKSLKKHK